MFILVINRKTYLIESTQFNRIIFFQPYILLYKFNATNLQIFMVDIHATAQFHNNMTIFINWDPLFVIYKLAYSLTANIYLKIGSKIPLFIFLPMLKSLLRLMT